MSALTHKLNAEKWDMIVPGEMIFFAIMEKSPFCDIYWGAWRGKNDWCIYCIEEKDMMKLTHSWALSEYIHYHWEQIPLERVGEFVDCDEFVLSLYRK